MTARPIDRRGKPPTVAAIVAAQECLLDWLGVAPAVAHRTCWACRILDMPLERAHVVAHRSGGSMHPTNFFLLCAICHLEQHDSQRVEVQLLDLKYAERYTDRHLRRAQPLIRAMHAGELAPEDLDRLLRREEET